MTQTATRRGRSNDGPEIDFKTSKTLYVGYYSQNCVVVETVGFCAPSTFGRLVHKAARTARNPEACLRELDSAGLDFADDASKWFCLCLLARHHCRPFWKQEMVDNHYKRKSL